MKTRIQTQISENTNPARVWDRWANAAMALIAFLIILTVLFYGDNVGLSDQGDFTRVMSVSSLSHLTDDRAFVFIDRYAIDLEEDASLLSNISRIMFSPQGLRGYPSIQVPFVRVSVAANLLLNYLTGAPLNVYRLSVLGAMTALIYSALIFWLFCQVRLKNPILDALAKIGIIVVACDVGYIAYFNSFYSESIQILAFIMLVTTALRILNGKTGLPDFALVVFSAAMYGWSKFINLPAAFLIIIVFAIIMLSANKTVNASGTRAGTHTDRRAGAHAGTRACSQAGLRACSQAGSRAGRYKIGLIALAGILPLITIYLFIPRWMEIDTNYNSVFFGVAKDVDDETAAQYLGELGLSPEMVRFASTNRYVEGVADELNVTGFEDEFMRITKFDLMLFYLRHPGLLTSSIEMSIAHSGMIRPWYLSNYGQNSERLTLSNRFALWSGLRERMGFDTVYGNLALWLSFVTVLLLIPARQMFGGAAGGWAKGALAFAVLGAAAYLLIIQKVANGEGDLAKHMFAYIQFVDMVFVLLIVRFLVAFDVRIPLNGSSPLGGSIPFGGSTPLGGSIPFGGSSPLGGSIPFGGSSPLGGSIPFDGSSPLGGSIPFDGSIPLGDSIPVDGKIPVDGMFKTPKAQFALQNIPGLLIPVLCVGVLTAPVISMAVDNLSPVQAVELNDAAVGDVITFGRYHGEDLLWRVVDDNGGALTLISTSNMDNRAFDGGNSSFWVSSDLRAWLNGYFFDSAFDEYEKEIITDSTRNMILSLATKGFSQTGDREFYAFHIPSYAFRGSDRAYRAAVSDKVRLPDAEIMQNLIDMGKRIDGGYWLEIPRCLDDSMVRYVTLDGYVSMKDAKNIMGVRPVIEIHR
ncbi:MAG: DUF6273 domain-containing protein [Oscillospiraceae bacterium]|nr:DUF6273 domain-containing protein [Oscillospiraceae bacterium]